LYKGFIDDIKFTFIVRVQPTRYVHYRLDLKNLCSRKKRMNFFRTHSLRLKEAASVLVKLFVYGN